MKNDSLLLPAAGRAIGTNGIIPAAAAHRRKPDLCHGSYAWEGREAVGQLAIDRVAALPRVLRFAEIDVDGEQVLGLESGVGGQEVVKTSDEQERTYQEDERERDLSGYEGAT